MIRTIIFTFSTCGVVVLAAAIPQGAVVGASATFDQPGGMLLLAGILFGLAAVVGHHGKGA